MREVQSNGSRIDVWVGQLIDRYRYQILALLALLSIVGGVVLAARVYTKTPEVIEFIPAEKSEGQSQAVSFKVNVQGEVATPGVYEFNAAVTVAEVIAKAGGQTTDADISQINLDEKIESDREIVVSKINPAFSGSSKQPSGPGDSGLIGLNSASLSELMTLPGIGEVYANRIIATRPFRKISDLLNVSGIGAKRYAQIKELVSVE